MDDSLNRVSTRPETGIDEQVAKKPICLVTNAEIPEIAIKHLETEFKVIMCVSMPAKRTEILSKSKDVDAILWTSSSVLDEEILNAVGKNIKVVSTISENLDNLDIAELRNRKIPCGYTPLVLNDAVADLAIALLLAAARRIHESSKKGHHEIIRMQQLVGQDIRGSTVGFIGFGKIGQQIYQRLIAFEVKTFLYTTRHELPDAHSCQAQRVPFSKLLCASDFIFIVCTLSEETVQMVNKRAFSKMKENCILVNVAKAEIVDQEALYSALKEKKIFAAGLDVTLPEPLPCDHPLLSLPNCVISPNLGNATIKTREEMALLAVDNILKGFLGEEMTYPAYTD